MIGFLVILPILINYIYTFVFQLLSLIMDIMQSILCANVLYDYNDGMMMGKSDIIHIILVVY